MIRNVKPNAAKHHLGHTKHKLSAFKRAHTHTFELECDRINAKANFCFLIISIGSVFPIHYTLYKWQPPPSSPPLPCHLQLKTLTETPFWHIYRRGKVVANALHLLLWEISPHNSVRIIWHYKWVIVYKCSSNAPHTATHRTLNATNCGDCGHNNDKFNEKLKLLLFGANCVWSSRCNGQWATCVLWVCAAWIMAMIIDFSFVAFDEQPSINHLA